MDTKEYFKITDDGKLKTSELLQKCRGKFPVWCYWSNRELDKNFPKPRKPTTRYFKKSVEADEENANKSADDLDQKEQITIRERILMELAYYEETGNHLDKDDWTLCAGSRDFVGWYSSSARHSRLRSRSCIDPSTLNLANLKTPKVKKVKEIPGRIEYKGVIYKREL